MPSGAAVMQCPTCSSAKLDARHSHGIEVDVCSSCGGVWLDRGELDKIVTQARTEPALTAYEPPVDPSTSTEEHVPDRRAVSGSERGFDHGDDEGDREEWKSDRRSHQRREEDRAKPSEKQPSKKSKKRRKQSFGDRLEDVLDDVLDLDFDDIFD